MNEPENNTAEKTKYDHCFVVYANHKKTFSNLKCITKMKKIILVIFAAILANQVYSQDTSIVKYFPLKVGNIWVYQGSAYGPTCGLSVKRRVMITGNEILNSKKYFIVHDTSKISGGGGCFTGGSVIFDSVRVDSINGNIFQYSTSGCSYWPHEIMIDSLKARFHDKIKINCGQDTAYICSDTSPQIIFGQTLQSRSHSETDFESGWGRTFIKGIGQSYYTFTTTNSWFTCNLIGCVLDGILYGDTSFYTGIKPISNVLPKIFSLYQNYPNPFNPTTKIIFDIPASPFSSPKGVNEGGVLVRLVIYDLLGREVETLVNEKLQPGTYEVEWLAINYVSGVYFYSLKTPSFTETKKMVLLK